MATRSLEYVNDTKLLPIHTVIWIFQFDIIHQADGG